MGGGSDSRIPSILSEVLGYGAKCGSSSCESVTRSTPVRVICKTYDFDPEIAHRQIEEWLDEYKPNLIIGESLGSLHALRIRHIPVLLVSPALNTPFYFRILSWIIWIPGVATLFEHIYKPREGDRQPMKFTYDVLKKYRLHGKEALYTPRSDDQYLHAFFGTDDHYRRSGVVSLKKWKKLYGDTFTIYEGTHFMENQYVFSILLPMIFNFLDIKE